MLVATIATNVAFSCYTDYLDPRTKDSTPYPHGFGSMFLYGTTWSGSGPILLLLVISDMKNIFSSRSAILITRFVWYTK